jgi:hypothetical protein
MEELYDYISKDSKDVTYIVSQDNFSGYPDMKLDVLKNKPIGCCRTDKSARPVIVIIATLHLKDGSKKKVAQTFFQRYNGDKQTYGITNIGGVRPLFINARVDEDQITLLTELVKKGTFDYTKTDGKNANIYQLEHELGVINWITEEKISEAIPIEKITLGFIVEEKEEKLSTKDNSSKIKSTNTIQKKIKKTHKE